MPVPGRVCLALLLFLPFCRLLGAEDGGEDLRLDCPVIMQGPGCRQAARRIPRCLGGVFRGAHLTITAPFARGMHQLPQRKTQRGRTKRVPVADVLSRLPAEGPFDGLLAGSCALVASDPSLLKTRYGDDIDSRELVMRLNGAPTRRFEAHVGRKTTVRLVNQKFTGWRERPGEVVVGVFNGSAPALDRLLHHKVHALNPRFMDYTQSTRFTREGSLVSQGMRGLMILLHVCREVHVYGFSHGSITGWYYKKERSRGERYKRRAGHVGDERFREAWGPHEEDGEGGAEEAGEGEGDGGGGGGEEGVSEAGGEGDGGRRHLQGQPPRAAGAGVQKLRRWRGLRAGGAARGWASRLRLRPGRPYFHRVGSERRCFEALAKAGLIHWHRRRL